MSVALEFENISKEYSSWIGSHHPVHALSDFSLSVESGEIFGFLGPNGAGKSTAIHLAMGFMRPTRGRGRMLGHPFGDVATRRRVGFLAENVALYHRRAERLVRFYGALNGMQGAQLERRAREVIELLGLAADARRNVRQFSRGMLQRAGLAQALINDPELLILDEPTSALDPHARVAVRELLLQRRNAGTAIFLSSHMLSELELVCDRVAFLNHGHIVRLGTMSELLESAKENEIVARRINVDSFAGAAANDGLVRFCVAATAQRSAIERVWALGGEVVSVNPVRRSLEELFLEVTSPMAQDVNRSESGTGELQ
jgi:ABC-2 type transport system ATP-binding protein